MKIAITAAGGSLAAQVEPRFCLCDDVACRLFQCHHKQQNVPDDPGRTLAA
ncbi:MAG: hypothetical protein GXO75_14145 [Calditrichaeota bacterium]|nr:hypothetical protein [Calditrichota bacterium]